MSLTPKQVRFIEEFLVDLNATQAALRAGYKHGDIGRQLLTKTHVCESIAEAQAERSRRTEIDQDWVLNRLVENVGRAMRANPVLDKDGVSMGEYRYEGAVANRALELVGKHLGMFTDKPDIRRPKEITDLTDDELQDILLQVDRGED